MSATVKGSNSKAVQGEVSIKSVGVIGSRRLPYACSEQVGDVVEDLISRGYHIASGGAIGADQFVIERLLRVGQSQHCTVYTPWKTYDGFPKSIEAMMRQFKDYGGHILWGMVFAHQSPALVKANLLLRNQRIVEASYGTVAFIDAQSAGSIFTIRKTAAKRMPLVVFPLNCPLPQISFVKWVPLRCGGCWEGGVKAVYLK